MLFNKLLRLGARQRPAAHCVARQPALLPDDPALASGTASPPCRAAAAGSPGRPARAGGELGQGGPAPRRRSSRPARRGNTAAKPRVGRGRPARRHDSVHRRILVLPRPPGTAASGTPEPLHPVAVLSAACAPAGPAGPGRTPAAAAAGPRPAPTVEVVGDFLQPGIQLRGGHGLWGQGARSRARPAGDRDPDAVAPLGPRAVVIADVGEADRSWSTNQVWLDRSPIRQ